MNPLSDLRTEITDALTNAGIRSVEYVAENIVPPVALVIPADPYVTAPVNERTPFGVWTVTMQVLLIAGKGTNRATAEKIDSMVVDALVAIASDWDITEVTAPQEFRLKGVPFMGAVITLEQNTKLEKEVM